MMKLQIGAHQKFPNALKLMEIYAKISCRVELMPLVTEKGVQ